MTYPHFVELTGDDDKVSVNIDAIGAVSGSCVLLRSGEPLDVKESYDELKDLIRDAGCVIQKADPRLSNLPLSWDELTEVGMIGQPLFNSNSRHWMLLIDVSSDRKYIELINDAGGQETWIEHNAQAKPLYRMKVSS